MISYKILIVDDVIEQLKALYRIIERHHPHYKIYQVDSAKSALNLLNNITPDIIITDWEMPEMNGIDLIHELKSRNLTKNIPVIVVSGLMTDVNDLKIALEAGAMDYLRKPIEEIELMARVHSAISITEKHRELITEKENKIAEHLFFTNEVKGFLNNVLTSINAFCDRTTPDNELEEKTARLKHEIESKIKGTGWYDYSRAFNNLYPEFTKRLLSIHPNLTQNEIELCRLSKLGLSNKEIAGLMYVTPESMRVSRSRLRKKLSLETNQNLQSYLTTF